VQGAKYYTLHLALCIWNVHFTDQLSNSGIIPDYLKVVDFIEEMEDYLNL
jgi:hypothetical protein